MINPVQSLFTDILDFNKDQLNKLIMKHVKDFEDYDSREYNL
jgi:hypothetical protein